MLKCTAVHFNYKLGGYHEPITGISAKLEKNHNRAIELSFRGTMEEKHMRPGIGSLLLVLFCPYETFGTLDLSACFPGSI